ncbi:ATP-dependent DNA helicase, partial [Neobacillus drentensis]
MSNTIQLAVRTLVEHVYSSGSIDSRFRSQSTMLEGTRIHQKIQLTYQESDQKEVYLRADFPVKDLIFSIDGRCDGLLFRNGEVIIDEIKSTSQYLEHLGDDGLPVHWAQAKMYAYIYAKDQHLQEIFVQLTYVQAESEEKRLLKKCFSIAALEGFDQEVV